ncbi:MAG: NUDIX domain-containing protein [Streptosporangiaceae bacterium]|nr:NUDIX domain-containing protein [Streptosporangiaceae bacterium]
MKVTNQVEEGYRACPSGRHWGPYGAAGILPWTNQGGALRVLLGKRGAKVHYPGTWDSFGGALKRDELPFLGALRELSEEIEVSGRTGRLMPGSLYVCKGCGWMFHSYLLEVAGHEGGLPAAAIRDQRETDALRWVRAEQVPAVRPLHPRFAESWPELEEQLRRLSA